MLVLSACSSGKQEPQAQPLQGCTTGEMALDDGSCLHLGVPPDGCGDGFVHDGEYGCDAVLPADPCPRGSMAVVGEETCRPVAPCGAGRWGDIPVEPSTQYVDAAYAGNDSDGSEAKPWIRIQDAIDAADWGAIVAVTDGSYPEDVAAWGKAIRLWGRCPSAVEIVGSAAQISAIRVVSAPATEIHTLAVTGAAGGISIGTTDVVVDRVWVHDTGERGMNVDDTFGTTTVTVAGSLVEQASLIGIFVAARYAAIDHCVVRGTQPDASGAEGRGVSFVQDLAGGDPPAGHVFNSVVEANHDVGVLLSGATATIEESVVRNTSADNSNESGRGIVIQNKADGGDRSNGTVIRTLIQNNLYVGLFVSGSEATIDSTVVRDTLPMPSSELGGRGINVQLDNVSLTGGSALVTRSLVERSHGFGVIVGGADLTMDATIVRDTLARQQDGLYGDGLAVVSEFAPASVTVSSCRVADSERAGLANFGASVSLAHTRLTCSAFDLNAAPFNGEQTTFVDAGDNLCGCPEAEAACKVLSADLQPPSL